MKIAIVVGTRPDIIKMSPVIRHCQKEKLDYFVIHSGQHYSPNLSEVFFKELELPAPKYNLHNPSKAPHKQGEHTGRMITVLERIFLKEKPSVVFVQGDTTTALAGALAAVKIATTKVYTGRDIKVGHVEAGLRSYDRNMPEEINRNIIDHISDYLFAPTKGNALTLKSEGIDKYKDVKIYAVGNTIVEAVHENRVLANKNSVILERLSLAPNRYILTTVHRQESVDVKQRLQNILDGLREIYHKYKLPIIYPIHPRTAKMIEKFGLDIKCEGIHLIDATGYLDFLRLEDNARLILTDSGGVQEEACILKVPCITLRTTTERQETVHVGANRLVGYDVKGMISATDDMLKRQRDWINPFGDGCTTKRIFNILQGGEHENSNSVP